MGSETRYLFETDFSNPEANQAQARIYNEEDIEAARNEGLVAARAELREMEEKRAADMLAEMSAKLDTLSAQRAEDFQSATESAVDIAIVMSRKVLPTLATQNALVEIEGHIVRTLAEIHDEPRIVVRVADENIALLQPRIESFAGGFDGKIVLLADDQLPLTDCHVMWADGGNERDVQRTWSAIDTAVEQITAGGIGAQPAHPTSGDVSESTDGDSELLSDFNSK
ncbi:MAG: FliH/SctL family protein [Alphaproteobacteria bacterium]|nr:FliH/SctL family protein [Alphaproteobacteria bacterium]